MAIWILGVGIVIAGNAAIIAILAYTRRPGARRAAPGEPNQLRIENGRLHAVAIVKDILAKEGAAPKAPLAAPQLQEFQDGD